MVLPDLKVNELEGFKDGYVRSFRKGDFDDDDYHAYIRIVLGYDIPRTSYCQTYGLANHQAPWQFVSDCFFGRVEGSAVGFGCRSGGKTLDLAILENSGMILRAPLEIAHFGAVERQALKCYGYFRDFAGMSHLAGDFVKTNIGDAKTFYDSALSIAPATYDAVSGPHPHWAILDEVESLKRWDIFQKFQGMSLGSGGNHGIDIYTSTRDRAYGYFQRLLEYAEKVGWSIYKWCIWDVLARCYDDCRDCKAQVRERCNGRAKTTWGFYPIEDFKRKAGSIDEETWAAQFLCNRPMRTGAVYQEFDEDLHVSKEPIRYNPQWPVFLVGDPGWRAADKEKKRGKFVVADFQIDPYDRISVFRENRFIEKSPYDAGRIVAKQRVYPWKGLIWDTEDPGGARDFLKGLGVSIPIIRFDKGKIEPGIKEVRPFLKVRSDGTTGLLISKTCTDAIFEMLAYHYRDVVDGRPVDENPVDVDDHFPDCLRYFVIAYQKVGSDRPIVGEVRDIEKVFEGY